MSDAARLMQYDANKKSLAAAYILCLWLGWFGAHRFYLGRMGSAAAMLVITLVSIPLVFVVVGAFTLGAVAIWLLVDLVRLPGIVREINLDLASRLNAAR